MHDICDVLDYTTKCNRVTVNLKYIASKDTFCDQNQYIMHVHVS